MLLPFQNGLFAGILRLAVPCLTLYPGAMGFLVTYWKIDDFSTFFPVFGTGNEFEVSSCQLCAQALETVRMWEHLSSLFDQRAEAAGDLLLFGNADLDHLLRLGPGGGAAQSRQTKGDTIGILDLARAVKLSQSEERFDLIGAHRQTDMIQTKPAAIWSWFCK